jgi:endothelin-converting enzyme/putative endopeptidase
VLEIETELAQVSADPVTHRDFRNLNHKFSRKEFENLTPAFSWQNYLATVGALNSPQYTVTIPEFFKAANQLLQTVSLADWKLYLRWHLLKDVSPMLNRAFANEHFNFYDKILQGQQQQSPRWQRCLQATDRDLGDALGLAFVERTFSARDKEAASEMAVGIEAAMAEDIAKLGWMSPATKKEALSKLHTLEIKVGYPEKWRDYSIVRIGRNSWAENALHTGEFEFQRRIGRIGKPADRDDWSITTPTVDAYYSVQQNRMVVPAGFMGPPFFDRNMDDAVNFGGAGAGIGHELTHAFDNHGREFDAEGNLRDWWTPEDSRMFEKRAECVSKQYSQYVAVGDVKVNGELTLGENLADAAGLRVAFEALESSLEKRGRMPPRIDGLSPEQRFFLSYGLQWCGSTTPEMLRKLASNNPHSPPKYRVNGVLSNMSEFQRAFGCRKGQPMVRENVCRVW